MNWRWRDKPQTLEVCGFKMVVNDPSITCQLSKGHSSGHQYTGPWTPIGTVIPYEGKSPPIINPKPSEIEQLRIKLEDISRTNGLLLQSHAALEQKMEAMHRDICTAKARSECTITLAENNEKWLQGLDARLKGTGDALSVQLEAVYGKLGTPRQAGDTIFGFLKEQERRFDSITDNETSFKRFIDTKAHLNKVVGLLLSLGRQRKGRK